MDLLGNIEAMANVATALGLFLAIYVFWKEKRRESYDRHWGTYNSLDDKYILYLSLCAQNPELNIYNHEIEGRLELNELEKAKRLAVFEVLVSVLERSYLMYHGQEEEAKLEQWVGWEAYIDGWVRDARFIPLWEKVGSQYDLEFYNYVSGRIENLKRA
jgi:hypothetical protein